MHKMKRLSELKIKDRDSKLETRRKETYEERHKRVFCVFTQ